MRDYIEFDTCPTNEYCVQVSKTDNYMPQMREQANAMLEMLREKFPDVPGTFKISSAEHDFGTYLEIRYYYNVDSLGLTSLNLVEENFPQHWSDNQPVFMPVKAVV